MSFILTIDDSPTITTRYLLDFFNEKNINAVFFCIGKNMKKYPDLVNRMIKENHIVANHSFSHKRFSKISNIREEIEKTDKLIDEFYRLNNARREIKFFRFPYQDKGVGFNPFRLLLKNYSLKYLTAQSILKSLRYKNFPDTFLYSKNPIMQFLMRDYDVFTNLNFKDWKNIPTKKILSKIENLDFNFNYILQLHDIPNKPNKTILIIKKIMKMGGFFELPKGYMYD